MSSGPEDLIIAGILGQHGTASERLAALEHSEAPELTYGLHPWADEEAEIATVASYLQAKKRNWRAEVDSRAAGNPPNRQSWEAFQYEMGEVTPGVERNQPVWFMQADGYRVTGTNQTELNAIGAARERPAPDDPQQLLGMSYQRDTMYAMLPDGAISRHVGTFDAATVADAWVDGVVRVHSVADELRLRITAVADGDMSAATMLLHEGRLSFDETSDVMAFAIADMVVSGEHSLPECMTSVVMAAGSSQPWQDTPLNLSKETTPLTAWLHLVSPETRDEMRTEARTALLQLLANPTPDPKVVKGLTMLLKATAEYEQSQPVRESIELAEAVRVGLNPTPASAQRVAGSAAEQNLRHRATSTARDADRDRPKA